MNKTLNIPKTLFRMGGMEQKEDGTMRLSISSDEPYERFDWMNGERYFEVLDHSPGAVDMSRLKMGAALLYNHDRAILLGGLSNPECVNGRCYVSAKMSEAPDVESYRVKVSEGILKDTSIGYEITSDGEKIGEKSGLPIYKFKFAIHEASLCPIAADPTVGVGRSRAEEAKSGLREITITGIDISGEVSQKRGMADPTNPTAPVIDEEAVRKAARDEFKARCKRINDHFGAIKNDKWKAAVEPIRSKHLDGEADFEAFRTESNNAIDALTSKQFSEEGGEHSGIVVVGDRPQRALSIGAQFVRSKGYEAASRNRSQGGRNAGIDIDFSILGIRGKCALAERAGFTSSDLSAINVAPMQNLVALGVQRLTIMDLIAPGTTDKAAIPYPKENSFGTVNGVAVPANTYPRAQAVGERGVKPNWDADLTTDTANVRKVAVTTKVPDEFMADFPGFQSYIDQRLPYMVDLETEFQILYGDGLGNNLKGIFANAGVQTRAITTTDDSTKAASLKQGLTDIQVNAQFEPDGFAFHPYDWETASLLKDSTGRFLAGGPFYVPFTNGVFMEQYTFWGKPVAITTSVTYGRPLAGCWKLGAQYFIREGMRLETTNANEDDFKRNLICVRAEHRLALATYRPVAFLEFTGWPARA